MVIVIEERCGLHYLRHLQAFSLSDSSGAKMEDRHHVREAPHTDPQELEAVVAVYNSSCALQPPSG